MAAITASSSLSKAVGTSYRTQPITRSLNIQKVVPRKVSFAPFQGSRTAFASQQRRLVFRSASAPICASATVEERVHPKLITHIQGPLSICACIVPLQIIVAADCSRGDVLGRMSDYWNIDLSRI